MELFRIKQRIDLESPAHKADPRFSTDYLFGQARGKMFGILECFDVTGNKVILKAFSGQYNGIWEVDGWAPPLFQVDAFEDLTSSIEKKIKSLGREMECYPPDSSERKKLQRERKKLSQDLMKEIHGLYQVTNFRGETRSLGDVYTGHNGIPTGTGDCCAPKLFHLAARKNLKPLGLAEFYWGKENKSQTKESETFYPSCREKCEPILGFLLCGLQGTGHE